MKLIIILLILCIIFLSLTIISWKHLLKSKVEKLISYSYIPIGTIITCPYCKTALYEVIKESDIMKADMVKPISDDISQPIANTKTLCPICGKNISKVFRAKVIKRI